MDYQKENRAWKAPGPEAFAAFQRTVYDVALGIQTAQGAVPRAQLDRALERIGYEPWCEVCTAETDYAIRALEAGGHVETYLRVR